MLSIFALCVLICPLQVTGPSPPSLGDLLLQDIGGGKGGTCKKAIDFAKASLRIPDHTTLELAKLNPHNSERDLISWTHRQMWRRLMPVPYEFMIYANVGGERDEVQHSAFLPHEVFSTLYERGPEAFWKIMGSLDHLLEFWRAAEEINDEWYRNCPAIPEVGHTKAIPIGFHGDDAGVHGQEQVLVITWGSVAFKQCTLDSRIVFTMLKVAHILKGDTLQTVYNVLRWSFEALRLGRFPAEDHNGVAFSLDHHPDRFAKVGMYLAEGLCGVFAEMRGDWKFLREALYLKQHYGLNDLICHRCSVHKLTPDHGMRYTNFKRCAPHRATQYSHAYWMALMLGAALVSPLLLIPGFHISRVFFDALHCLELGIYQVAVPSFMKEVTSTNKVFEGANRQSRFKSAFRSYSLWRKKHVVKAYTSKPFNHKTWLKHKYPRITQLTMKGAALRSMIYWCNEVAQNNLDPTNDHDQMVFLMFRSFEDADKVCRAAGRHFTRAEHARFCFHLENALVAYNALAVEAGHLKKCNWKLLPKFHAVTHYYDCRVNPRRVSCYQDEDMVGRVKKIYVSCHGKTAPSRSLERYAIMQCLRWWSVLLEERLHLK